MGGGAGVLACFDELLNEGDVSLVNDVWVMMPIHCGKVNDGIAGPNKIFQFSFILKVKVFKWYTFKFIWI